MPAAITTHAHATAQAPHAEVLLRWALSRRAAYAANPGLVRPDAAEPLTLELRITRGEPWTCSARLHDGPVAHDLTSLLPDHAPGSWTYDPDNALDHLDLPGVITLTRRSDAEGSAVLYAATEIFRALRLPGGAYELQPSRHDA